eukprot:TRINITY_DN93620_c0_g1_i1.p1 TRINITY_DN93620_c0_g1~~TRINITY_DN93620_c0_g1_i1.p1  ORF type:complete len:417 (-),score=65.07 TRINITY_DN93620_c0_g1_i1:166-1374(-)
MKLTRPALSLLFRCNEAPGPAVRCFAGGRQLRMAATGVKIARGDSLSNRSHDGTDNLAFAIVRPPGVNTNNLSLNPFRPTKTGPDVLSLVTVRTEPGESGTFEGVQDASMQEKLVQACTGQGSLRFKGFLCLDAEVKHATGQRGKRDKAKLVPGAAVVANLDSGFDFDQMFYLPGSQITSTFGNLGQGYGKIVEVFTGPDGQIQSADVAFEGVWSDVWSQSVQLHYLTDGGFFANVPAERLLAHASFRNLTMMTTLDFLQWEMALLWPETVPLEELVFVDVKSGALLSSRAPNRIRSFLEQEVAVEIRGKRVPVLDPTLALPPPSLNLAVTTAFAAGGVTFLTGLFCHLFWLCPAGMVSMLLAHAVQTGWRRIALEERSRFAKELEGLGNQGQEKLESGAKR